MSLTIRPAKVEDAPALAPFVGQLGYPVSAEVLRGRLERLLASPADRVIGFEETGLRFAKWLNGVEA